MIPANRNLKRLALYLLLWGAAVVLYSRHLDFAAHLHSDEPGKIRQVQSKDRNFHHPTLMLEFVHYARKAVEESRKLRSGEGIAAGDRLKKLTRQEIAELGRLFSAMHTATAIVFLTLAAEHLVGALGALCCGAMLLANERLYYYAHFFKEEPMLILGLGILTFTLVKLSENPRSRFAWMAFGLGLAAVTAGKYIGIVFVLVALPFAWQMTRARPGEPAPGISRGPGARATILLSFLAFLILLHHEALAEVARFFEGFSREWEGASRGHRGLRGEPGFFFYLRELPRVIPVSVALLATGYCLSIIARRRKLGAAFWFPPAAALTYFAVIALSPKFSLKYSLPFETLLTVMASLALAMLLDAGWQRRPGWKAWLAIAAAVALTAGYFVPQTTKIARLARQWNVDHTAMLWNWIRDHLPENAHLIAIPSTLLPGRGQWIFEDFTLELPQQVTLRSSIDSEPDGIAKLMADGVTHVVVSRSQYQRYFGNETGITEKTQVELENRASFYRRLETEGKLIFEIPVGPIHEIQKDIQLFELPAAQGS